MCYQEETKDIVLLRGKLSQEEYERGWDNLNNPLSRFEIAKRKIQVAFVFIALCFYLFISLPVFLTLWLLGVKM